jgi:hypothetical protein
MSLRRDASSVPSAEERRAARLLELGRTPPRRAVDLLLEDLAAHGAGRLEELLRAGPAGAFPPRDLALSGASLAALVGIKERCKSMPERDLRGRLQSMAGYFTSIAAALVQHRTRITRRSLEKLEPILLDLAAATQSPWSELFTAAGSLAGGPDCPGAGAFDRARREPGPCSGPEID